MANRLVDNYRAWRRYRQTYGELSRLTDRELDDLGLSRYDLRAVSRNSAGM